MLETEGIVNVCVCVHMHTYLFLWPLFLIQCCCTQPSECTIYVETGKFSYTLENLTCRSSWYNLLSKIKVLCQIKSNYKKKTLSSSVCMASADKPQILMAMLVGDSGSWTPSISNFSKHTNHSSGNAGQPPYHNCALFTQTLKSHYTVWRTIVFLGSKMIHIYYSASTTVQHNYRIQGCVH